MSTILGSELLTTLGITKLSSVRRHILKQYPFLSDVDITYTECKGARSGKYGFEATFMLHSNVSAYDGVQIDCKYTHSISQTGADIVYRRFRVEMNQFISKDPAVSEDQNINES